MRYRESGQSRGFGFAYFRSRQHADKAIADSRKHILDGRPVEIQLARSRDEMRGGGGGGSYRGRGRGRGRGGYRGDYYRDYEREESYGRERGYGGREEDSRVGTSKKIFVGGIPTNATQEQFESYFSKFGTVSKAILKTNMNTGRVRGFGFVTFEEAKSADAVIKIGYHKLNGKEMECVRAYPKLGGGGGGGGYDEGGYGGGYDRGYGGGYRGRRGGRGRDTEVDTEVDTDTEGEMGTAGVVDITGRADMGGVGVTEGATVAEGEAQEEVMTAMVMDTIHLILTGRPLLIINLIRIAPLTMATLSPAMPPHPNPNPNPNPNRKPNRKPNLNPSLNRNLKPNQPKPKPQTIMQRSLRLQWRQHLSLCRIRMPNNP
ncbi:hypothetical protein AAMO2058_000892300 [Amorphochlora amoebiformis]